MIDTKDIAGGKQVFLGGKVLLTILIHQEEKRKRARVMVISGQGDIRFRGVISSVKLDTFVQDIIIAE